MMGETVNGLPVGVLVVLGGIALVCALWLALRFGRAIAIGLGVAAILAAILVGTVALAGQSAANYETARVATKAVQAVQTAQTSNMLLVGALGCAGGVAVVAVLALAGVALYLWYRTQRENQLTQVARVQRHQAVLAAEQPAQVMAGDFDLSWLDNDNWQQQGEAIWESNEQLHW